LPRPKHGFNVRDCYTVPEGYAFVCLDFSSAEVKILANMAKEPAMLRAIVEGLDFHSFSASEMYGIPYDVLYEVVKNEDHHLHKEYKGYRQIAKVLTFSLLYGSSAGGIATQLNLEKSESERLVDLYFKAFPGVRNFIESAHKMAELNQYVITPLGQRKREYGTYKCFKPTAAYNAALRNAQNVLIQSTTSSVGLITFAELNARLKPLGVISTCTVYDSVEMEVPIDKVAEVVNLSYDILNNWPVEKFDFLELPIGCDCEVGISWGELRGVHQGVTQEEVVKILDGIKVKSLEKFGF
jgi:DNA polymerase-1